MQTWPPKEPYCPHCGQPAPKTIPPLTPGVHLTIAERLMWLELAKTPGCVVPKWRLAQYCENENVLRQYMTFLRHKTGRIIRNVRGEGYVLEREGAVLALRPRAASVRGPRRSRAPSPQPIPPCSATR